MSSENAEESWHHITARTDTFLVRKNRKNKANSLKFENTVPKPKVTKRELLLDPQTNVKSIASTVDVTFKEHF